MGIIRKFIVRGFKYKSLVLILAASFVLSGCASLKHQKFGYKVDGKEYKSFKDLSDEHALKVTVMIYNINAEGPEEKIAKSITLTQMVEMLKQRKSAYLEGSGIFDIQIQEIDLKTWTDEDLVKVYKILKNKVDISNYRAFPSLTEEENAYRVMYLTGMTAIVTELKKRDNVRQAWSTVGQVLVTALSIAVSAI
jgi:hypothetical protein